MSRPTAPAVSADRRALLLNSGWLLAEKATRLVVGQALVTVLLARFLGPVEFGVLSFAIAVVALCGTVAGLGIEDVLVRELVRRPARDHAMLLASAWRLKLIGAIVATVLAVGAAVVLRPAEPRVWVLVGVLTVGYGFTPWDVFDAWFQAQARFAPPVRIRLAGFLVSVAGRVALILAGAPLWQLAAAMVLEPALVAIGLARSGRAAGAVMDRRAADRALMRALVAEGWPLLLSGLFVLATMQLDKVLVAQIAGDAAAGHYAAATRLSELFYAVPVALGAAAIPGLARQREADRRGYWQSGRKLALAFAGGGLVVALLIAWRADDVVHLLFGARFEGAAAPLAVHVWSLGFIFLVSLRGRLLVLEGRGRLMPILAAATAAVSLGLNLWLIPRLGAVGAAWAATGAWGFSALLAPALFPPMWPLVREFFGGAAKP